MVLGLRAVRCLRSFACSSVQLRLELLFLGLGRGRGQGYWPSSYSLNAASLDSLNGFCHLGLGL